MAFLLMLASFDFLTLSPLFIYKSPKIYTSIILPNILKISTILLMIKVNSSQIQNVVTVFIEIDNFLLNSRIENSFEEFQNLVNSSDVKIKKNFSFNQKNPVAKTFISKGKLESIKSSILDEEIDLIIINHQLSASQNRNLELFFKKRVIDKTELILDIFATRASSHIGKLQVELAQLDHMSTRLIRGWTHLERQKGGIGLRGPGETQLETDRRLIGKRIKTLKLKLEKYHNQKKLNRYSRYKSRNKIVALVGYTNAGKTTLFNKLTNSSQVAEDKLFATLDSVTRKNVDPNNGPILFSDTVGFISDLPTQLIESFKATLDELKSADMLLHVVDLADDDYKSKMDEVNKILLELDLQKIPQIIINNKCDLVEHSKIIEIKKRKFDQLFISAEKQLSMEDIRKVINKKLFNGIYAGWVSIENNVGKLRSTLFDLGCIVEEQVTSSGKMYANIQIGNDELEEFKKHKGFNLCHKEDILLES